MNNSTNVLIIGAGVVGLTLGIELLQLGYSVTCIEKRLPGTGSSNVSLGLIYPISPLSGHPDLVSLSVEAFNYYRFFLEKLNNICGRLVDTTDIGMIQVGFSNEENIDIEKTYKAYLGINFPVERMDKYAISKMEPNISESAEMGIFFPTALHVHCEQLIEVLTESFAKLGGKLVVQMEIGTLLISNDICHGVKSTKNTFYGDLIVLCTGAWHNLLAEQNFVSDIVSPVRGQVVVLRTSYLNPINHLIYTKYLDIVPRASGEIFVGSTIEAQGFNQYATAEGVRFLLDKLTLAFPITKTLPFEKAWAGLRPKTMDELPLVGKVPEIANLHVSTGHYRNGIFLSPMIAKYHAQLITTGELDHYLRLFQPSRLLKMKNS